MTKISKRIKAFREKIKPGTLYGVAEALSLLKQLTTVKFDESVDICINLGIDTRKSDQTVRGATVLPHGTGKKLRVAVFAQGTNADAAKEAGADIVGYEDLVARIKEGHIDFDVLIATPDAMRLVGQLGQILGPKGLMPNPKVGTVTPQVAQAVRNAKSGQVQYRADKGGIIHCSIGKISFAVEQLSDNLQTFIAAVQKAKPPSAKGIFLKKVTLTTTMGPGLAVDVSSLLKA